MTSSNTDWDLILVGGGLANGLIAYRLAQKRPDLRVLVVEAGPTFGGNHTWSSHVSDIDDAQREWTEPFVAHRWSAYHVSFPGLNRRIDLGYQSVTSERFDAVLKAVPVQVRFETPVDDIEPQAVYLATGETLAAGVVLDGRGAVATPHLRLGWQKFLGREILTVHPHRLTGPLLMDATVAQIDGYRFVYVLPLDTHRLLIEDTYYADGPGLDVEALRGRIADYALDKGWVAAELVREETGVLPITLAGDFDAFWAEKNGQPSTGLRAGLFHPTTGYSWPDAVRLADLIAASPDLGPGALFAATRAFARSRWSRQRMFRALNRMLFLAGTPEERWTVMRRFYRFPAPMIARFYAGELAPADKMRLLVGKPPVPIREALRALADTGVN